jgi:hypothetical protein
VKIGKNLNLKHHKQIYHVKRAKISKIDCKKRASLDERRDVKLFTKSGLSAAAQQLRTINQELGINVQV